MQRGGTPKRCSQVDNLRMLVPHKSSFTLPLAICFSEFNESKLDRHYFYFHMHSWISAFHNRALNVQMLSLYAFIATLGYDCIRRLFICMLGDIRTMLSHPGSLEMCWKLSATNVLNASKQAKHIFCPVRSSILHWPGDICGWMNGKKKSTHEENLYKRSFG